MKQALISSVPDPPLPVYVYVASPFASVVTVYAISVLFGPEVIVNVTDLFAKACPFAFFKFTLTVCAVPVLPVVVV